MNELTTKANGTKKVSPRTETEKAIASENSKNVLKSGIIETTAEKRLKNLDNFQKVCQKYTFVKKKSDELNSYLVGRDGLKETVIIENTDGQTFEISNTFIIGEILDLCQNKLFDLVEKTEKEVTDFKI